MRTCRQAPHGPTKRSLMSLCEMESTEFLNNKKYNCGCNMLWSLLITRSQRWQWSAGVPLPPPSGWPSAQHTLSGRRRRSQHYNLAKQTYTLTLKLTLTVHLHVFSPRVYQQNIMWCNWMHYLIGFVICIAFNVECFEQTNKKGYTSGVVYMTRSYTP